jgi:hypothetical protein
MLWNVLHMKSVINSIKNGYEIVEKAENSLHNYMRGSENFVRSAIQ